MTYATSQDLIDRFGMAQLLTLADREGTGELDAAALAGAFADADQEIDAYLATRYALPLSPVPGRIKTIAADIAFYRLHPANQPDDVRRRYQDALAFLRDLSAGRALLDAAGTRPAASGGAIAELSGPDRVFSRDTLESF